MCDTLVLLDCGHYATIENNAIKLWPGWAYCPICEMSVLTDAYRREIEEDDMDNYQGWTPDRFSDGAKYP